ncbi:hypothetical protein C8R44DRAFT_877196 [Mycena epipterygia]|nr:hypothetical protein C8R44DRAFT_877196 [Mycena epipterygia]
MPTAATPSEFAAAADSTMAIPGDNSAVRVPMSEADYYLDTMRDGANEKQRLIKIRTHLSSQKHCHTTGVNVNARALTQITAVGKRIQQAAQRHAVAEYRVILIRLPFLVAPVSSMPI